MKVYKVKIIKVDQPYYVNEKQKKALYEGIEKKTPGLIQIGNDQIKLSSIEYIRETDISENELPSYFVKDEEKGTANSEMAKIMKLPTETLMLDMGGNIITGMTRMAIEKTGKPYMLATVHYVGGSKDRQYHLESKMIPRLIAMVPDGQEMPYKVKQVWKYGVNQF